MRHNALAMMTNAERQRAYRARRNGGVTAVTAAVTPTMIPKNTTWQPAFLAAFRNSGNVRASCLAAGATRQTVYALRRNDADFAAAWMVAEEEAIDVLEAEARRRAMGTSDTLLIFLLKAHRPDKYREQYTIKHKIDPLLSEVRALALERGIDADAAVAEAQRLLGV